MIPHWQSIGGQFSKVPFKTIPDPPPPSPKKKTGVFSPKAGDEWGVIHVFDKIYETIGVAESHFAFLKAINSSTPHFLPHGSGVIFLWMYSSIHPFHLHNDKTKSEKNRVSIKKLLTNHILFERQSELHVHLTIFFVLREASEFGFWFDQILDRHIF